MVVGFPGAAHTLDNELARFTARFCPDFRVIARFFFGGIDIAIAHRALLRVQPIFDQAALITDDIPSRLLCLGEIAYLNLIPDIVLELNDEIRIVADVNIPFCIVVDIAED